MDNEKEIMDVNLDQLMQEFQKIAEEPRQPDENSAPTIVPISEIDDVIDDGELSADAAEAAAMFSELAQDPVAETTPVSEETSTVVFDVPEEEIPEEAKNAVAAALETEEEETRRVENISEAVEAAAAAASEPTARIAEPTMRVAEPLKPAAPESPAAAQSEPPVIPRSVRLRELKRKIVAGPEKRYYTLNGMGVAKVQICLAANLLILLLCIIAIGMFTLGKVPATRMKLMIFSQVLAMLGSGLLGCGLMMDGIADLFKLRFSLNSTLVISFIACCVDGWFSLNEQRVPCCGAFVLEMSLAILAKYHRRTTEMAQMDTLRKASSLTGLTKKPQYYEKYSAILRGAGDVEDFMDTYSRTSGPEIVQRVYGFIALIASIGIAVLGGLLHGPSLAAQVFAASLMVSVPAGYFISLTRPAAILEKRLHMVGTVICGWQGVKKLCGKAVFPLRDKDLFPRGSTKLNGIKFYSEHVPAEVVSYTASLIFAAGGGLVPLFRNLLASRNGVEYPVEHFRDYGNGGIGGEVNGEPVLLGGLEFLQDMGVEIPKGTMVSQAIYVAIDGQLAAVIAITYSKMRSAAAGLVSLCGSWKLKPLLLAGDFMLTDSFIRNKFSIRGRKLIVPDKERRAELLAVKSDPESDVLALVTRDDLVSSVYAATGSMALRTSCRIGTIINMLGGIAGIAVMLALAYLGTVELLTPIHVMLYQLVWLIPGWLATEWTRTV